MEATSATKQRFVGLLCLCCTNLLVLNGCVTTESSTQQPLAKTPAPTINDSTLAPIAKTPAPTINDSTLAPSENKSMKPIASGVPMSNPAKIGAPGPELRAKPTEEHINETLETNNGSNDTIRPMDINKTLETNKGSNDTIGPILRMGPTPRFIGGMVSSWKQYIKDKKDDLYDYYFSDGTHTFQSKNHCVGYNVNKNTCDKAIGNIPLKKTNMFGFTKANFVCHDCFVGFKADFFFAYDIKYGKLVSVACGFKNAVVSMNLGVGFDGIESDMFSYSKDLWSMDLNIFNIAVPGLDIASAVSMDAKMSISLDASLGLKIPFKVNAGYKVTYEHGDDYVSWDKYNGWGTTSIHEAATTVTPYAYAEKPESIKLSGELSMPVKLDLTVNGPFSQLIDFVMIGTGDDMFTHKTALTPKVSMQVTAALRGSLFSWLFGKSWQICASGEFSVALTIDAILRYPKIMIALETFSNTLESFSLWPDTLKNNLEWVKGKYQLFDWDYAIKPWALGSKCYTV